MKHLIKFHKIILFILIITSCQLSSKNEYSIIGNWATYSKEFGYVEYLIDSINIFPCSYTDGLYGPIKYVLRNDSVIYVDNNDYKAKLSWLNEDTLVWISKSYIDTFYRLPNNEVNFHEIKDRSDSIIDQFKKGFAERNVEMILKKADSTFLDTLSFLDKKVMTNEDWIKIRNKNK